MYLYWKCSSKVIVLASIHARVIIVKWFGKKKISSDNKKNSF